jgi:hypothetical protein
VVLLSLTWAVLFTDDIMLKMVGLHGQSARLQKHLLKKSPQKKTHLQIRQVKTYLSRRNRRQHLYMSPRGPQSSGPH